MGLLWLFSKFSKNSYACSCGNFVPSRICANRYPNVTALFGCLAQRDDGAMLRIPSVASDGQDSSAGAPKKQPPYERSSCGNFAPSRISANRYPSVTALFGCLAQRDDGAMLRIPSVASDGQDSSAGAQKKQPPYERWLFFWCSCGNSNPGHLD